MVTFIVGPVNSGKTTRMAALYKEKGGDGVLCPKVLDGDIHQGYDLVHLRTGEATPFARFKSTLPADWDEAFTFGPYSFSAKAQGKAAHIIGKAIETGISPVFLDEIGPVELEERGFANLFRALIKSDTNTIVSVRDFLLDQIITFFDIKNNQIHKEQI